MAKKIKKSQEDEVIAMLKREGFHELRESDIEKEPYKSIYSLPECFEKEKKVKVGCHSPSPLRTRAKRARDME